MRAFIVLSAATAVLGLSACASGGQPISGYAADLNRLQADCEARNGILVPIPGASTGRVETEYACEIRNATRLND